MIKNAKRLLARAMLAGGLVSCFLILLIVGCGNAQKEFDPNIKGPQMIAEPNEIRLGIARVMGMEIVFKGQGFQPGDSVFVTLMGVKKREAVVDIPIADGEVDRDGYFKAEIGKLGKISELLRVELGENEKLETIIIVTQPPIPEGVYTARAVSMESDKKAECQLVLKGPSILDRFKDWMGKVFGKIVKE
jgi:hypothetical protein